MAVILACDSAHVPHRTAYLKTWEGSHSSAKTIEERIGRVMQQPGQQPLRPTPVQGSSELQQLLDLVRLSNMHHGRSAFNSVPGGQAPYLPEFSLYNAAQLSGLLNNHAAPQNEQLAQLQQWQTMQNQQQGQQNQQAPALSGSAQPALPESSTSRSSLQKGIPKADKSSNAYATRHQAAEQRRRTRINDR